MAINKNLIVDAGIDVRTSANVTTTLGVGGNTTIGGFANIAGTANIAANTQIGGNLSVTGNVNVGGTVTGAMTFAGNTTFLSNVTISGNLTVSGTTTFINTATLAVADNMVTLNSDWTGAPTENAGIEVNRGTSANVQFMWDETNDVWSSNSQGVVVSFLGASANVYVGANSYINTTAHFIGNSTVNTSITATNIGGVSNAQLNVVNAASVNATTLVGVGANTYINTTAHFVGNATVNSIITSSTLSIGGPSVFYANTSRVVIGAAVGIQANGSIGTAGQVLHSNGTSVYWDIDDNTVYDLSSSANTIANEAKVNLSGSDATVDTVKFIGLDEITTSSNSTAVYVDHADVARTNNTSSASPASGGTFTAIDSVTTNARGHVTAINTKTVTLPIDPDTKYDLASVANTAANEGKVNLTGSDSTTDTVKIIGLEDIEVSSNSTAVYMDHKDIARTDGTTTAAPASGGTFTAVDSVTTTARGHVTAINVKTVTLPDSAADASSKAATAYSNAVSTSSADATSKAATAYSNAVSTASADATSKAATAYSNATSYAASIAATAYSNATSYAASIAATAYSNAVSTASSDATSKAATAYSNAVSTASADATSKAATAYSNATTYSANASNLANGTVPSGRLTGTYNITISGGANTANNSTYLNGQAASYYTDIPSRLGFTPVQQGGGTGQGTNKVYIGWAAEGTLKLQVDSTNFGNSWPMNVTGTAGGVAWTNVSGRPTAVSSFTNDSGYITTNGRAYPRRSDGGDLNFYWSGQTGQPNWLWGGSDGTNMYVYNPSNFSVNYATSAGSVAWSNVSGRPTAVSSFTNDSGYVTSSGSVNYATSAGSVAWSNVSGRPTAVSSFTNDAGYVTSVGGPPDLSLRLKVSTGVSMTTSTSGATRTTGFSTTERNLQNWTVSTSSTTGSFSDGYVTYYYTSYDSTTITLPAGSYYAEWFVTGGTPYVATNSTITGSAYSYLYNVTDSSNIATGSGVQRMYNTYEDALSLGKGYFTLGASKTISVRQYAYTSNNSYGSWFSPFSSIDSVYAGYPMGTGEAATTTYAGLRIWKV